MARDNQDAQGIDDIPEDLIEMHGTLISSRQVLDRIRRRVSRRREESGYGAVAFPSYGGVPFPDVPEGSHRDPDLYHHLRLANKLYTEVDSGPLLAPSPATRMPLIGWLWRLVRHQAHQLVLFYVNRAVRDQVEINRHLISVLNSLTEADRLNQERIRGLQEELEDLRARLEG